MNCQTTNNDASCGCAPGQAASAGQTVNKPQTTFQPAVDILETSDEFVIHADVPGATSEGIELTFEEGVLNVKAPIQPRHAGDAPMRLREYGVGDFKRSFRVGGEVDSARITANVEQGVLTVHLPKSEAAKPRKIAVQSNN